MKRIIAILLLLPVLTFAQAHKKDTASIQQPTAIFNNVPLHSIIHALCKQYRYDAYYVGNVPNVRYCFDISYRASLTNILAFLQKETGVQFSIKNRVITIRPPKS